MIAYNEIELKRIRLPDSFEARFIVGRSMLFVPVLSVLLFVFWRAGTKLFWLFAIKYCVLLAIAVWMAFGRVQEERTSIEKHSTIYSDINLTWSGELAIMAAAGLVCGVVASLLAHDWRWIQVSLVLGLLIFSGLAIRWAIYDRWIKKVLSTNS
ncbi:MAG: hypothetical protein WCG75_01055 [Armatimonadota bacterium]